MKEPGQGGPGTLSYDRPRPEGDAGSPTPARAHPATRILPEGVVAAEPPTPERPARVDPAALGPAPLLLAQPEARPPSDVPATDLPPGGLRPGSQLDHFEIVGLIGKGGMGCVYKALDRDLGRTVAIKTLHGLNQQEANVLARFRREAQAASRVVHPNLVIIYSFGTHRDTPYIVMEYLSGHSLADEIAKGALPIERALDILVPTCAGVYAAHRAGVVHRDLKPANIFLARTPMGETPKILDFGISRMGDDDANLTGTGNVVGTTYYLAPEQAAGQEVDASADQYALGVILYECLTGVRPFAGSVIYAIMRNIVEGVFESPSRVRPDLPTSLEAVIMRAMSRLPGDRFARVRDLGLALMPFMSALGRQQWSHHFTAPEAGMPIAPSAPMATPSGADAPLNPTKIAPTPFPMAPARPAKVLADTRPDAWQLSPTRTADEPPSLPMPVSAPHTGMVAASRRSGLVAVAVTSALVVFLAIAAWVWRNSTVDHAARSAPSAAAPSGMARPSAAPAPLAPAPAAPTPAPMAAVPPTPTAASATPAAAAPPGRPAPRPRKDSAKPTPRKPKQARQPSVKFTPEGVPII